MTPETYKSIIRRAAELGGTDRFTMNGSVARFFIGNSYLEFGLEQGRSYTTVHWQHIDTDLVMGVLLDVEAHIATAETFRKILRYVHEASAI